MRETSLLVASLFVTMDIEGKPPVLSAGLNLGNDEFTFHFKDVWIL